MQTLKNSRGKNWNQRRKNTSGEQGEANIKEPQSGNNNNKGKKKLKFPFLACKEDHFTKDCPRLVDVQKFVEKVRILC